MNNRIKKYGLFLSIIVLLSACKIDNIDLYEQEAGLFFPDNSATIYTFMENPTKVIEGFDYVVIPVEITGSATDYNREFELNVEKNDTLHTAEDGMIEFEKGIVPAGAYVGSIKVKINYSKKLDDSVYVARVKIIPNEQFPVSNLNFKNYSISFGNVITIPENWSKLKTYFGNFSKSWYSFMLTSAGVSSFPYKYSTGAADKAPDAARWPMTIHEVRAYASQVRDSLNKYNDEHPLNPKIHEDGEFINTPVKMGSF